MKKRNWEIEYEKYKSADIQVKLEELKNKLNAKTITREEYDEYQKMLKIIDNLPKVDNVIEYMEKLDQDLGVIKEEIKAREEQKRIEEKRIKPENLEKELEANLNKQYELIAKRKEINRKIALSSDEKEIEELKSEREDVEQDLSKLEFQVKQNNEIFAEIHSNKKENKKLTKTYLAKYSDEDLRAKCFEISAMISKCNMVASNLMKGLSRESLQVKLDGWKDRKFTSKDPLPLTRKEKAVKQQGQAQQQLQGKGATKTVNKAEPIGVIHGNSTKTVPTQSQVPVRISEFAKEFPRLAKRFPNIGDSFLGKALLAAKKTLVKREEKTTVASNATTVINSQSNKNSTQQSEQNQQNKKEMFKNYVKYDVLEVADKGLEETEKEYEEKLKNKMNNQKIQGESESNER